LVKGMYTAASGMMLQLAKQDVVANNIANSNTNSFKRQLAVSCAYPTMNISRREGSGVKALQAIGQLGSGAVLGEVSTDFSTGSMMQTGVPTDLALGKDAYFVVETPQGERFTRCGSFKMNFDGLLSTSQGFPLLDENGEYIFVEPGFTVDKQGNISANGITLATLQLVRFENQDRLLPVGENLYAAGDDYYMEAEDPQLMQGFLEQSNVNAVREMVTLLAAVRAYEMLQKVVQAEDELTQVAVDKVGALE
jgi:flagellar basal-body rod protein FlgF